MTMTKMDEIAASAKALADARGKLGELVGALNAGVEALKRDALPDIRSAITEAEAAFVELHVLVTAAPDLFVKPRTVVMDGIKLGYEKGKGSIAFEDANRVVALILKHFPDREDALIKTTRRPLKDGLALLTAKELKALGCTVQEAGDRVVIRPVATDVDKLVAAFIAAGVQEAQEAAAEA